TEISPLSLHDALPILRDQDVIVEPRWAGPAYGVPDQATIEAIRAAARLEGMITDPVYEGKSMAGLIALARSGEIPRGSRVLYVRSEEHTSELQSQSNL